MKKIKCVVCGGYDDTVENKHINLNDEYVTSDERAELLESNNYAIILSDVLETAQKEIPVMEKAVKSVSRKKKVLQK